MRISEAKATGQPDKPGLRGAVTTNNASPAVRHPAHSLFGLQRTIGNQKVTRLVRERGIKSDRATYSFSPNAISGSRQPYVQRDAEAADVGQESLGTVEGVDFLVAGAVVAFDRPSPPAGVVHAPVYQDLLKSQNIQVSVPPGSSGTVTISTRYLWKGHLTALYPMFGWGDVAATARFIVTSDGHLEFTAKQPLISRQAPADQPIIPNTTGALNNGSTGAFGSMDLQIDLVATTTRTVSGSRTRGANEGRETGGESNIDLGIGGYKGGHKDVSGTSDAKTSSTSETATGSTIASRGWSLTLTVPPPEPARAIFHEVRFDFNEHVPKKTDLDSLRQWFTDLPDEVREGLRSGKYRISFQGQASRTGTSDYNLYLSKQRNREVARELQQILPGLKIDPSVFEDVGFFKSKPGAGERDEDRSVRIKIEKAG